MLIELNSFWNEMKFFKMETNAIVETHSFFLCQTHIAVSEPGSEVVTDCWGAEHLEELSTSLIILKKKKKKRACSQHSTLKAKKILSDFVGR